MSGPGQPGWRDDPAGPGPGYGGQQPGYGGGPSYGGQPGYGGPPSYGDQPGAGGQPGYGTPGYGSGPAYGEPAYGEPSYGDPGYGDQSGGYGQSGGYVPPGGGYGNPYGTGPGGPPPKKSTTGRTIAIIVVAVIVLVGGGLGIAAAAGVFSGDTKGPVANGTSSAPSTSDFGTGSPTAGQSSSSSSDDASSSSSSSGDYDSSPPSEDDSRDTVEAFLTATNDKDVQGALDYVCPDYQSDFGKILEAAGNDAETAFAVDFDKSEFVDSTTEDNARLLTYTLAATVDDGGRAVMLDYAVTMQSLDGDALICGRKFTEK